MLEGVEKIHCHWQPSQFLLFSIYDEVLVTPTQVPMMTTPFHFLERDLIERFLAPNDCMRGSTSETSRYERMLAIMEIMFSEDWWSNRKWSNQCESCSKCGCHIRLWFGVVTWLKKTFTWNLCHTFQFHFDCCFAASFWRFLAAAPRSTRERGLHARATKAGASLPCPMTKISVPMKKSADDATVIVVDWPFLLPHHFVSWRK